MRAMPVCMERTGRLVTAMKATPNAAAFHWWRRTNLAQRSQMGLYVVEDRGQRQNLSSAGPTSARHTGSRVTATQTAMKGISMLPNPTLRRNGTGSTTSDSRPTAAVRPLSATARPALLEAASTASGLLSPLSRSSRQRITTISEKSMEMPRLSSTIM